MMTRYVIVGSGAAGISAIEGIRSKDRNGEIHLITEDPFGYYSRPGLAYLLTGELDEASLYPFTKEDQKKLGIRIHKTRISKIDIRSHKLLNAENKALDFDRLLIATGSTAVGITVPGHQLAGVVKLDNLSDARNIRKMARNGHRAVVIGGGITALEILEGLVSMGVKVHYFLRGDRYWSNVLDEIESRIIEHRLQEDGVKIHYHAEAIEFLGKKNRVTGVRTKQGQIINCDLVAVAIGVQPRKELAEISGLQVERGIIVDDYMRTSQPDIFSAGDVAQVYDPLTGKSILDTLWGPARAQGYIAGLNMVGIATRFIKPPAFNVTRLAGLTTTIIGTVGTGRDADLVGIARGDSESWRQMADAVAAQNNFEVNRLRILVGWRTLLGAVVMGDQSASFPLQDIIRRQLDISSIRKQLLVPGAPLVKLVTEFWKESNLARS
jgi:NAD(P)H-nitrite reductase large subunit